MSRYLIRRLLIAMPSLLGISVVLFTMLALAPGDPFGELATNPAIPPSVQAALRAKFGLDDPIPMRYLHWLTAMLHGDWGFSFVSRMNVDTLILQRLPTTLAVIGASQVLALLVALPVGVYRGDPALFDLRPDRQHVRPDRVLAADVLHRHRVHPGVQHRAELAALRVPLGPAGDRARLVVGEIKQSIMPIAVLGLFQGATWTRFVRSAVLDVIRLDYVTTARSKGLPRAASSSKHIVRNALIPVVTLVALQMPIVFGGAIVTEQIFRVPGIGSLLISAILANDTPVIMAVTFVFACLVILFNLIADLMYGWLDPRISYR